MTKLPNHVCVAVDHRYSDNNGAYTIFYLWDGVTLSTQGGIMSNLSFDAFEVNASISQINSAAMTYKKLYGKTPFWMFSLNDLQLIRHGKIESRIQEVTLLLSKLSTIVCDGVGCIYKEKKAARLHKITKFRLKNLENKLVNKPSL